MRGRRVVRPKRTQLATLGCAALVVGALAAGAARPAVESGRPSCYLGPGRPFRPPGPAPSVETAAETTALLRVDLTSAGPPLAGVGLNLEPSLWSCAEFQASFERDLVDPLHLLMVRASLAQAPWLPPGAGPDDLNWQVYQQALASPELEPSWAFIARLNALGIEPIVMHWGAPGLMTDDGTQFGRLRPEYYVAYAEYYTAAIDYLVRQRGLRLRAASPMNEPDCGDGSKIDPRDYPTVLKLVAERIRPYCVGIYAPDTCSADDGGAYLEALLQDPVALAAVDIIGVHQYSAGPELERFIARARAAGLRQPIYVSEFTTFDFGNLDGSQEASDELGYTLAVAAILRSHLLAGADAALYWDGVDYLQQHHAAVTKWGLLRGPADSFAPRLRYAAFRQLLPQLGPGARLLTATLSGDSPLLPLAVRPPAELGTELMLALINPGGPVALRLEVPGEPAIRALHAFRTDVEAGDVDAGVVPVSAGLATLQVPARSLVTLVGEP